MLTYLTQINQQLAIMLYHFASTSKFFHDFVIFFGRDLDVYVIAGVMFIFLFHHHSKKLRGGHEVGMTCIREMILLTIAVFTAWLTSAFLKVVIGNLRPFEVYQTIEPIFTHGGGDSFPSGHATVFASLSIMLFMVHRKAGLILMLITFLISVSRIAAGIHFPFDVVVGWVIGASVSYFVFNLFRPRIHR